MAALAMITTAHNPIHAPVATTTAAGNTRRTVAFTTPANYATRLCHLLNLKSITPLWCPTIVTESTSQTLDSLAHHLSPHSLSLLSAIAFPSRTTITAFSTAALSFSTPLLPPRDEPFIIAALGKDAELIDAKFLLNFCADVNKVRVIVPQKATPSGLVESLGAGGGRNILCPVPKVAGLEEPPVVPNFLRELASAGWVALRVDAYETRWLGPSCAQGIVERGDEGLELDAMIFTSSGEVEGLLKSLSEFGWDWKMVRRKWPHLVAAAHGPVTAAGARRLGVDIDVVSAKFDSFDGVVDALDSRLKVLSSNCM